MFKLKNLITLVCTAFISFSIQAKELTIVATIFPIYDFVNNVTTGNDEVQVKLLMQNGADLHSFAPSAKDMIEILNADAVVYIGGPSDKWLTDALANNHNKKQLDLALINNASLRLYDEEIVEGMQVDEHDHHNHEHEDEHAHNHEHDLIKSTVTNTNLVDEHIWLSLKNAKLMVNDIATQLATIDSTNAKLYLDNAKSYIAKLEALDEQYTKLINLSKHKEIIVADRFAFVYLVKDYNLNYAAAFPSCSAETNASFNTIAYLANKLNNNANNTLLTLERSDNKVAKAVISNSNKKQTQILTLDSMQAVTNEQIAKGISYLSIMQNNLHTLQLALN